MEQALKHTRAHFDRYRQPVKESYIDVLDGVRAVLVLLVGAFHIWQQSWLTPRCLPAYFLLFLSFHSSI